MHHIRGGMGSGETYTRPKEYHSGEEEQARHMLFFESGIWECLRREERRGEELGCQVWALQID